MILTRAQHRGLLGSGTEAIILSDLSCIAWHSTIAPMLATGAQAWGVFGSIKAKQRKGHWCALMVSVACSWLQVQARACKQAEESYKATSQTVPCNQHGHPRLQQSLHRGHQACIGVRSSCGGFLHANNVQAQPAQLHSGVRDGQHLYRRYSTCQVGRPLALRNNCQNDYHGLACVFSIEPLGRSD